MLALSFIALTTACYCILAQVLKITSFRASRRIGSIGKNGIGLMERFDAVIETLAVRCAPLVPMNMVKTVKLTRLLRMAGVTQSPKQYMATRYLTFLSICIVLGLPLLLLIDGFLAGAAVLIGGVRMYKQHRQLIGRAQQRIALLETELPQFTANFYNRLQTNSNVLEAIDDYRRNFSDTELSKELAITVADMRTGSQEIALQRLELRLDVPLATKLIRGILATMAGEDMRSYFVALCKEMDNEWANQLDVQANKVNDKIAHMTVIRSLLTVVVIIYSFVVAIANYITL